MTNKQELGMVEAHLVKLYAKKYNMTEEEFLAELDKMPGKTIDEKLREYANSRRGVSATGNLLTVYREQSYPRDDGTVRYRVAAMVYLTEEEQERLAKALNLADDQKSILGMPIFTVWYSDKKLVDRLQASPVGSKVMISNIRVSYGDKGGVFLNAGNIIPQGVDYEFLNSVAATPSDVKSMTIDEGRSVIIKLTGSNIIPDPVETSTAKGQPKVRIYVDDTIQLDIAGTAYTKLKQEGDPNSAEFWAQLKDKPVYVRAIYQRHVGDLAYFTCISRGDLIL